MIIPIFGLPGNITEIITQGLFHIFAAAERRIAIETSDNSERTIERLILSDGDDVILLATHPTRRYGELFSRIPCKKIVVFNSPLLSTTHIVHRHHESFPAAARIVAASIACIYENIFSESAIFVSERDVANFEALLKYLLHEFGADHLLPHVPSAVEAVSNVARLIAEDFAAQPQKSTPEYAYLHSLFDGYERLADRKPIGRIVVMREFFSMSGNDQPIPARVVDATGRPRCLFWGPYFQLPAGRWTVRFVIGFSGELVGRAFCADVACTDDGGMAQLALQDFTVENPGRREIVMSFHIADPTVRIEFRLDSQKAVFDGKVALGYAELTRAEDGDDDIERAVALETGR